MKKRENTEDTQKLYMKTTALNTTTFKQLASKCLVVKLTTKNSFVTCLEKAREKAGGYSPRPR
ncbi:hypothetical protein E2C01_053320 [Portunus trituberculatus]|uniref:Uncharacterized protein n=1 Tax=Portunus trituberculatus TaxID=210409 RepID=A0A5B7GRQ6_PORTR|nr:hypothetical protein [Portunus trituberculatus]